MDIRITQHPTLPDAARMDTLTNLAILLPATASTSRRPSYPFRDVLEKRIQQSDFKKDSEKPLVMDLPNAPGTRVSLSFVDPDVDSFRLLTLARHHAAVHLEQNPRRVALILPGLASQARRARLTDAFVAALLAATTPLPSFKSDPPPPPRLREIALYGFARRLDLRRTLAEAEGNNLSRALTALPPNELTPGAYRRRIARLARREGWALRFLDQAALEKKGAGAFLAVAQGSPRRDAGMVRLSYTPPRSGRRRPLALVGKGICFDTGGMNLKPAKHMHGMHEDMQGSAVALGTLLALSRLRVPFPVHCWLALAQNHIGPGAYKQNDVVTACNGTTIEVVHTDAEGRMVLADTLALAVRDKPALVIDYATLTGACIYALSSRYSGACSNRPQFHEAIIRAGRASGERVWPFPMDEDFDQALESQIADVKQCTLAGEADHILAARFLQRFVAETPWIHVDLAAGNHKGGLAHIPTDITGFGVRFTTRLLLDERVMET
ncbi:MAG TPA: leucyl aminopeptidase family protein [Gammaproteobacteria bacterium]|nr:leucyl aminopeptidase family protein [Gammaproteobacteria bacterium]